MTGSRFGPKEYLLERIEILGTQIDEIDREMSTREADHERIVDSLGRAKAKYIGALNDENELELLSHGKDIVERRQRMNQIIRGVNTGIFDELRVFRAFLKSLNAEKRQIQRELSVLRLRAKLLERQ